MNPVVKSFVNLYSYKYQVTSVLNNGCTDMVQGARCSRHSAPFLFIVNSWFSALVSSQSDAGSMKYYVHSVK